MSYAGGGGRIRPPSAGRVLPNTPAGRGLTDFHVNGYAKSRMDVKHPSSLKSKFKSKSNTFLKDSRQNWCGLNMVWCAVGAASNDSFVGGCW